MSVAPILDIRHLSLEFPTYRGTAQVLSNVCLQVRPQEIVALVGESGSGKSVAAMASIRLLPPKATRITGGEIRLLGHDVLAESDADMARLRGRQVSMVFQEPMSALNPTLRVGRQIEQVIRQHERLDRKDAQARAIALLAEMQVPDANRVARSYPFELSGGTRQRVLLAMAFSCNPQLLIADEPTTALDVTVQAQVLGLLRERARARAAAVLLITHDLAVVAQLCSRVYVMYAGQIVEYGETRDILEAPRHPYTRALIDSLPESGTPGMPLRSIPGTVPDLHDPPGGCRFKARCPRAQDRCSEPPPLATESDGLLRAAACWFPYHDGKEVERPPRGIPEAATADTPGRTLVSIAAADVRFPVGRGWGGRPASVVHALNGIDLDIQQRETLAVVGESGCGKSTLARLVMALIQPNEGRVRFDGVDLRALEEGALRMMRRRMQIAFQDPQGSLDPRMPAWKLICEPLRVTGEHTVAALRARAAELAELVGIRAEHLNRYPHEFSGGQRQRLAIARALALEPELLVLDEPTSALDVSVQAQILNLLMQLQSRLGLTYLFISHNVAVVRHIADRVAVMYRGQIIELGQAAQVLDSPRHPYTRQLILSVPRHDRASALASVLNGEPPSALRVPTGCYFQTRCAFRGPGCEEPQLLRALADGRQVRCHRAEVI